LPIGATGQKGVDVGRDVKVQVGSPAQPPQEELHVGALVTVESGLQVGEHHHLIVAAHVARAFDPALQVGEIRDWHRWAGRSGIGQGWSGPESVEAPHRVALGRIVWNPLGLSDTG
jgi:hypothetical protein